MSRRPMDAVVALLLDNAISARFGAIAGGAGEHDLADIVQETLEIAWRRAQCGALTLPDDPAGAAAGVRAYLYTVARHQALYRMRSLRRHVLLAELPEQPVDPLPRLEARSELRHRARRAPLRVLAEIHRPGASLFTMVDHLYGDEVPESTAEGRRRRLRKVRRG